MFMIRYSGAVMNYYSRQAAPKPEDDRKNTLRLKDHLPC